MGSISRVRGDAERGANLVEFAILAPLLIALVFGIVEFAWAFAQNLGVRSGAREGARIAAVDFGDGDAIANEVCARTDFLDSLVLEITSDRTLVPPSADLDPGDEVTVGVTSPLSSLTGLYDAFFPADLSSTVAIRIEQGSPMWADGTYNATC